VRGGLTRMSLVTAGSDGLAFERDYEIRSGDKGARRFDAHYCKKVDRQGVAKHKRR